MCDIVGSPSPSDGLENLGEIYRRRFASEVDYRDQVWRILTRDFFSRWVGSSSVVLDLGCGYGEFINNTVAAEKYGMDANSQVRDYLSDDVHFLVQDCSAPWDLPSEGLDVVFSSNFFEHLPNKSALERTLSEAHRCLRRRGLLIALGPNIRYLGGRYWDFWDHYLPLTEASLAEVLELSGLSVVKSIPRFLPYTMSQGRQYPGALIRAYLKLPIVWKLFGRQFLLAARKN